LQKLKLLNEIKAIDDLKYIQTKINKIENLAPGNKKKNAVPTREALLARRLSPNAAYLRQESTLNKCDRGLAGGGRLVSAASAISRSPFSRSAKRLLRNRRRRWSGGGGGDGLDFFACDARRRCEGKKRGVHAIVHAGMSTTHTHTQHRGVSGMERDERRGEGWVRTRVRRGPREGGAVGAQNPSRRRPPVCDSCVSV